MASDVIKEEKLAVEVVIAAVAERSSPSAVFLGAFDHQRTTTAATDKCFAQPLSGQVCQPHSGGAKGHFTETIPENRPEIHFREKTGAHPAPAHGDGEARPEAS